MSPFAKVVMSLVTAVVLALSLRSSVQGSPSAATAAPAGVVQVAQRPPTASASAAPPTPSSTPTPTHHKAATKPPTKPPTKAATKPPTKAPSQVTVNGGPADTMYGPVQVQITLRGSRIISAHAIVYPQGSGTDQQINSQAIPQLDQETVQVQSAQIDTVSGATFTSDGYRRSLQSAIDAAHQATGQ